VWHSGSKYLNGHGDVMLGAVVGRKDIVTRLRSTVGLWGLNANPFECWLATRGMRTLPLRMARVSATAMELAGFLKSQRGVARVDYPGLPDHPTHAVASRMLSGGFGGMLSFELPGGRPAVGRFLAALKGIPFSPTLADARTTISYPAGTSHRAWTAAQRAASNIPDGLVRLSVGLEEPAELKAELTAALVAAG
jgi:cystathionine beta-lyase/cystathionine gamma-synthase